MRKSIGSPCPRPSAFVLAGFCIAVLAGCDGGPAINLAAHDINESGAAIPAPSLAPDTALQPLPLPEPTLTPAQQRDAALAAFLQSRQVEESPDYRHATTDLDGDGIDDLLMLLKGPAWCGRGGCSLLVFHGEPDDSYRLVTRTRVTRAPIAVSPQRHNGWHDLLVSGGTQTGNVALQFNGESYPTNPTLLATLADSAASRARTVIE